MSKSLIFIHGGGENGYEADTQLCVSLQNTLGEEYEIHFPRMPSDKSLPDFRLIDKIDHEVSLIKNKIILAGHCLGASMLLKFLYEKGIPQKLSEIFLIATPYWKGNEVWKQGLKLQEDFVEKIPKNVPVFFYQCKDDEVISPEHLHFYAKHMPQASIREIKTGGHQLNNDLSLVIKDIQSIG